MKEQELKEKIIGIVLDVPITGIKIRAIIGGEAFANNIAEALIAAGIGDVSEYKHRAEVVEKEREEYRNSNRIVLRGIEIIKRNILRYCATDFPTILQQAEKELQEEMKDD